MPRQPTSCMTPLPASGASIGEIEITSMTIAISRVAVGPGMQVADDRPRHHHHRRRAEPLHEARGDQRADRRRQRAGRGSR